MIVVLSMPKTSGALPRSRAARRIVSDETPLRRWLLAHNMSQETFARRIERPLGAVSRWSTGKTRPPDDAKIAIYEATLDLERELKVKSPRGIEPGDWFVRKGAP